ncbi:trichohyalin [Boleophthalmus pectinirostris]|uniref:trichohyalin n=1 Tax=Boleophthalmus pectinirostris TaxID=150288 RepID=UPI00242AC76E|nr:trichohyalin [Boleophthalmus pectinirostris]
MDRIVMEVPIKNEFPLTGLSTTQRKRQVRFSARHDILLLREVIAQNPFASKESGKIWARVGEIITAALQDESFEVDARRCRERTMLLLDYYKKQDFTSLRRFGSERLYAQKEDLLHEVLELEAERGAVISGDSIKYQDEELNKRAIEELTLLEQEKPTLTHTTHATDGEEEHEELAELSALSAAPTAKRPCQCCCQTYSEILSFLEKRSESEQRLREEELALRREELEIQRSKIALERERLGSERRERERRFELESQERQVILDLLKEKVLKS